MRVEGRTGVQRNTDDMLVPSRIGSQGEVVVSDMNGFFYEQVMRGNGFVYPSAIAGSAPVAATTTNVPFLWNPSGSGKNLVIIKVVASITATGTAVAGAIAYASIPNAGSQIGTAQPVVSGTFVAATNLLLGAGNNSVIRFCPTTVVTTATPTVIAASSIGQCTAATTAVPPVMLVDWVYGAIIIPPGNTFQIVAGASIASTYCFSIFGLELPIALTA